MALIETDLPATAFVEEPKLASGELILTVPGEEPIKVTLLAHFVA